MKINASTRIIGTSVILVPYKKIHVERYHEWMQSPELQHFTASEPLTLEQEYEMQKKWRQDEDKCTFIILDKDAFNATQNEIDAMIGDTNLYFNDPENSNVAEAEIMIADVKSRRKKMGWESMILMLLYGIEVLNVKEYIVKITMDNVKSINMFQKLSFNEVSRSEVFQEITFKKDVNINWVDWLHSQTPNALRDDSYSSED